MNRSDTLLLVIDVQEKLWPHVDGRDRILSKLKLLLEAAGTLGVRVLATEQYPKGLGRTIGPLAGLVGEPIEKIAFSAGIEPAVLAKLDPIGIRKILIVGIETHVCVAQTALDLLASGFQVYIAADAVGSRQAADREWALRRLEGSGIVLTSAEAAVFEWTQTASAAEFKEISRLVKEIPVDSSRSAV